MSYLKKPPLPFQGNKSKWAEDYISLLNNNKYVYFLDVGQADSTLLLQQNKSILKSI